MTVTACSGSTEPPSWFAQRTELPSCGEDEEHTAGYPDREARTCFREAFEADRPAELTRLTYGDEGESIRTHFRVLGSARYEIVGQHFDGPADGSDPSGRGRYECDRFVFVDEPGAGSDGAPETNAAGECEQVEHVSA
ncbi:hypothetical protein SAMN05660662_1918 [Blastococcus aurantiacus]|uniref:Uncharacterized protein n=1 Tax=Blastococcus aurantiacus TaxID=1550231 RepID=A0A1G7KK02_9ACTN|nr:hypothetical protein [Blastococcus aurantiacus]SDF37466.1 hypothetical protein SAMN05660662_1918 [Blastococcus aurantiacus]